MRLLLPSLLLAACDDPAPKGEDTSPAGSDSGEEDVCASVVIDPGPDGEGTTDMWLYDGAERPLRHVESPEYTTAYHEEWEYQGDGDVATYRWFWGEEWPGYQAAEITYTYDGDDQLVLVEDDAGPDGAPEHAWAYGWDAGLLVEETQTNYGETWYTGTRTYDADDQLERRRLDYPSGDFTATWDYTWESRRMATESYDDSSANGGRYERKTIWTYDEAGRELREEIDSGSEDGGPIDGVADLVYLSTWEGDDLSLYQIATADDVVTWQAAYTYEDHRIVAVEEAGWDVSGTELFTVSRAYAWEDVACP